VKWEKNNSWSTKRRNKRSENNNNSVWWEKLKKKREISRRNFREKEMTERNKDKLKWKYGIEERDRMIREKPTSRWLKLWIGRIVLIVIRIVMGWNLMKSKVSKWWGLKTLTKKRDRLDKSSFTRLRRGRKARIPKWMT